MITKNSSASGIVTFERPTIVREEIDLAKAKIYYVSISTSEPVVIVGIPLDRLDHFDAEHDASMLDQFIYAHVPSKTHTLFEQKFEDRK